jgi:POTRA domain, FtsQ-type
MSGRLSSPRVYAARRAAGPGGPLALATALPAGGAALALRLVASSRAGRAAGGGGRGAGGGGSLGGGDRVVDFRRRGAPPRRRRRSPLLALARPLAAALLTLALPLGLGAWILTSPSFALRHIVVRRPAVAAAAKGAKAASAAAGASVAAAAKGAKAASAAAGASVAAAASATTATSAASVTTAATAARVTVAGPAPAAAPRRVPPGWVQQALAPLAGRNLLRLPLAEVRQRLAANPWIGEADVAKRLPDRLLVSVAERRPALLLRSGGTLLFADAAGMPIAPVGSGEEAAARRQGLLEVSFPRRLEPATPPRLPEPPSPATPWGAPPAEAASAAAGALRVAAELRLLRPGWTAALSRIEVVDEDDYQLHVDGLPCPLLVRGGRLAGNLSRFERLLPELARRYPSLAGVDLRFARRIVIEPASAPSPPSKPPARRPARAGAGAGAGTGA